MNVDLTPESKFTHSEFIHSCKSVIRPCWVWNTFGAPLPCLEVDLGGPLFVKRKVSEISAPHNSMGPEDWWLGSLNSCFFLRELSHYEKDVPFTLHLGSFKARETERKHFPHAREMLEGGGDRHRWPHQITERHLCSWELKMRPVFFTVVWRQHLGAVSTAWLWLVQMSSCAGSLVPTVVIVLSP